ncbi:hypothetical protein GTZ97_09505 [Aquabacterium fontiphilum]|jgi:hypothetical protein|uniref:hypothetical protein n=1 Tax=Aquabacterium fontiphilum TaxID=450365 RepID=UPI001376AB3D|nr:hypothetical protein [Aquabacterium fontiphilum]NBD20904.1 hypothetical protein [Aquabacterium fontiphilum]
MSAHTPHDPTPSQIAEMQSALFTLRDSLMNLKMSLLDLAAMTDEQIQRQAELETDNLLARLRG